MITLPTYVTREALADALDVSPTGYDTAALDRSVMAGTGAVETLCRRVFWPEVASRVFDWPNAGITAPAYRLYLLGEHSELADVPTSLTSGGVTIDVADTIPGPADLGAPFGWLDLDTGTSAAYSSGPTWQSSTVVRGVFAGCPVRTRTVGELDAALDASSTAVVLDPAAAAAVGCGDLLNVGTERMLVTGRTWVDTTIDVTLTASSADNVLTGITAGAVAVGERLLVGGERLRVVDVAGTSVTVARACDGSVLTAHTAADLYASRSLIVERAYGGTTAAAHADADGVAVQVYPPLVAELALAEALVNRAQVGGAYARPRGTSTSGNASRAESGTVEDVRARCEAAHRRYRQAAV